MEREQENHSDSYIQEEPEPESHPNLEPLIQQHVPLLEIEEPEPSYMLEMMIDEDNWHFEENLELDSEMFEEGLSPEEEIDSEDEYHDNEPVSKFNLAPFKIKFLPVQIQSIYQNIFKLKPLENYISIPESKNVEKLVCAKIVHSKDTIVECFDCRKDPSCIICLECFKNGNHEGHRYLVKSAFGGCCDCGDVEAWSEEGFCDKHSGKFKDFEIEEKDFVIFREKMVGLFYLYFWCRMKSSSSLEHYFRELMKYLEGLNTDNLYYNKLFTLVLCEPLPKPYSLTPEFNKRTILENLLTYEITKKHFERWFKLFITMFSYYPLKSSILSHYMNNYRLLVDGSTESRYFARSIACQLLTSFKLVEQYALENKNGLGHDLQIPEAKEKLENYFETFSKDMSNLANLPNETSLIYFRMHINNKIGLNNMFMYYDLLVKKISFSYPNKAEAFIISNFIDFSIIERQTIWNFVDILKNVRAEPELLAKIIKSLWQKCEKVSIKQEKVLCILRPYERCLSIALFAYFDCSLQTIPQRKEALINEILSTTVLKFEKTCSSILRRLFFTLNFYSRTQAFPGLGQTCYKYIYYYKLDKKILGLTDLLSIKLFILLVGKNHLLDFESIVGGGIESFENVEERKEAIGYLAHILETLRYLFLHTIPEIYITNGLNPKSTHYAHQIKSLFISIFKEHKNSISFQDLKTNLFDLIEFPSTKSSKEWLAEYCTLNKQNKMYSLRTIYEEEMLACNGLNYDDLWLSESSKDPFADIKKSLKFFDEVNMKLFILLWNEDNIACLENLMIVFMQVCESNEELRQIFKFLTLVYSINKVNSLNCKFDKKIIENSKGIIPNSLLLELELKGEDIGCEQNENERKEKAQQIKARKLLEMKKKRSNFLKTEDQPLNVCPEKVEEREKHLENCCCICRSEINENSILLVNLEIRDHEKLLNLGTGIECLSLNTCRHVFDYDCIMKKWKFSAQNVFCPLCKFSSNLLFPASLHFQDEFADQTLERMMIIMKSINPEINLLEELIKSFYHYFLLCKVDFGKCFEKKGFLYLTLYDIICKKIRGEELLRIESNFKEQKFFSRLTKKPFNAEEFLEFSMSPSENNDILLNQSIRSELVDMSEKLLEGKNKEKEEYFQNVTHNIIESIKQNGVELVNCYNKESKMEEEEDENSFMNIFIRALTDKKFQLADLIQLLSQTYEKQNFHILQTLPFKYSEIINKKCTECSEMSIGLLRCLLCNWQGCQKCKDCQAVTHIQKAHGTVGAVMNIQNTSAYYLCEERKMFVGKLYESVWQNSILKNGDWENFELKEGIMLEIERRLLLDDLPTRGTNEES